MRQALGDDPFNEQLHLMAASLAHNVAEAIPHVEQVLAINPHNDKAQAWLARVRDKTAPRPTQNGSAARALPAQPQAAREAPELTNRTETSPPPTPAPPPQDLVEGCALTLVERLLVERRLAKSPPSRPAPPDASPVHSPNPASLQPAPPPSAVLDTSTAALHVLPSAAGGPGRETSANVAPSGGPALEAAWLCPLCERAAPAPQRRCPQCHAAVHLGAAEMITRHEDVDEAALRRAIDRWRLALETGPSADAHVALALAHLNLGESADALTHLRQASELRGHDLQLREAFHAVRARKLVVIADEDEALRRAIAALLERHRLRTRVAANGFQALSLVEEEMPDLILASASMPRMAGYELCKVVRGNASTKGTPVVLLADKAGLIEKARGRAAGATGCLTKPVDGAALLRLLKSLLPDSNLPDPKLASNTMLKL